MYAQAAGVDGMLDLVGRLFPGPVSGQSRSSMFPEYTYRIEGGSVCYTVLAVALYLNGEDIPVVIFAVS